MKLVALLCVLAASVSAQTITYNIVSDFGATCNGSADDASAFAAFNTAALTWQVGHPGLIELDTPATNTCEFKSLAGNNFAKGIKQLLVKSLGTGGTRGHLSDGGTSDFPNLAGQGEFNDNAHSARVQTVTAGASAVTLVTAGQASLFTTGPWALLAGIDMQGYGFPINPGVFEYRKILTIVGGVITFDSPIQYSYKSTWPLYNAGSGGAIDNGGPATLYALDSSWDTQVEYQNLIFDATTQIYANGRSITFTNVDTSSGAITPTQNSIWVSTGGGFSASTIEVDKVVESISMTSTNVHAIDFQSTSVGSFAYTSGTIGTYMHGTPTSAAITSSTIHDFEPGAWAFGITQGLVSLSSTVLPDGITPLGFSVSSIDTLCSLTLGVFRCLNSSGPFAWAVPGSSVFFKGAYAYESGPFAVLDLTQDATYTYVSTTLTGGYPTLPLSGGHLSLSTNPTPQFSCSCTGSANAVGLSYTATRQSYSYFLQTYAGNISTAQPVIPVFGPMVSITFNVTKAYTGVRGSLPLTLNGPFVINSAGTAVIWSGNSIDLKTTGTRTITMTTATGSVGADSISAPGAGTWLLNDQMSAYVALDISGEDPSVYPSLTIQMVTFNGLAAGGSVISGRSAFSGGVISQ